MKLPLLSASLLCVTAAARACDLCACELPSIRLEPRAGWYGGVSEQYTDYGRLQDSGHRISNPAGQYMHSSISQVFAGYDFGKTFGVQLNVPYIHRTFRRVEEGAIESGTESGLGDISLIGSWTALRVERGDFLFTARVTAGLKFPTGDSSRLREEGAHSHGAEHEDEHEEGHDEGGHHDEADLPSGIHGHDLALGTGSIDGVFGADLRCQWKRAFFETGLQYTLRGDGLHSYDFADDLSWHAGGGFVVAQGGGWAGALGVRFSGETKGEDSFRGERLDDTGITTVFVGPRLSVTHSDKLSVSVGIDFPIRRDNSGVQTVPDYRVQGGVNWQF